MTINGEPIPMLEPQAERISAVDVLSKLNPREVEAEEGSRHTIYTFENKDGTPVEILFYSPNELPLVQDELKDKNVVINGDTPKWRSDSEWEDFTVKTLNASANTESSYQSYAEQTEEAISSGKGMLLVEAGPETLLETATQLDIELSDPLQRTLWKLEEKKLTEAGRDVLDDVIAGNLISDEGEIRGESSHEGEALYLLSMTGDKDAQQILERKRKVLRSLDESKEESDKEKYAQKREKDKESTDVALEPKDLVAVHTTRYLPKEGIEGLEVPTTFEATDWKVPRNTVHFALNHEVAAHMYGSWEDAPYVVIAPFEEMMESNGKPTMLNTVDTFWEVGPGERLNLPDNTAIVRPGELPRGEIISGVESNNVRYKTELEPEDIKTLSDELSESGRSYLNDNVVSVISSSFSEYPIGDEIKLSTKEEKKLIEIIGHSWEPHPDLLKQLQESKADEVTSSILNMAAIIITDEQREKISKKIMGRMTTLVKRLAVERKIRQMGYDVHSGGMWAWGDSWRVTSRTELLGNKLEVPVGAHVDHVSRKVEGEVIFSLGLLSDVEGTPDVADRAKAFQESKKLLRQKFVPKVTQEARRMFYLAGAI